MSRSFVTAPRILLVDANELEAQELSADLAEVGYEVEGCAGGRRLERLLEREDWDAVITDQDSAPLAAFDDVLDRPDPPVLILLAGFGSIDDAVESVRAGAADYLSKPISGEQLRVALGRALEQRELRAENRRLREDLGRRFELGNLKSRSPAMLKVFETVRSVADTRATILIEGESGTGKTLLARSIHQHSSRAHEPFVEVNCGALPDNLLESELFGHVRGAFTGAIKDRAGKFEVADRGTVFLDEISCASADLQVKLLRVLQDREFEPVGGTKTRKVDVRVIAASNRALTDEVAAGRFREDLFYRLNVLGLKVPPLRERPGDVIMLAEHFLAELGHEYERRIDGFGARAMALLTAHSWPGNVRELENSVEHAVLLTRGPEITAEALPEAVRAAAENGRVPTREGPPLDALPGILPLRDALECTEREIILRTLERAHGSRKETAEILQVNRTTLFNKMKKYNLMHLAFEEPQGPRP